MGRRSLNYEGLLFFFGKSKTSAHFQMLRSTESNDQNFNDIRARNNSHIRINTISMKSTKLL